MQSEEAFCAFEPPSWCTLADSTVGGLIEQRAKQMPFRVALSVQSFKGFRDRLSYAQLALYSRRMGAGLLAVGVKHGDRVAVYLGNDAGREAVLTALGCLAIGAVVVPMNIRSSDEELEYAMELVSPALVVCTRASFDRLRRMTQAQLILLDALGDEGPIWPDPLHGVDEVVAGAGMSSDDLACLLFTSGTTLRSKAVMHTHRSMIAAGFAVGQVVGLSTRDLYQGAFPFFTSSCLNLGCMSAWVNGAGFVMEHAMDNAARLRLIESERSTVYHGVPSVIQFMLDECDRISYGLRHVRRVAYGGAAMPAPTIARIAQAWPWMDQVQIWGMTESGPAGAWLPPHWLPQKAGLIGHAMPNCELKVVDESGRAVQPGEQGELCFRGPSMAQGYFDNPHETAQAFRDGWLHTGDVVIEDQDGLLCFVDRSKDVINRGGLKISSAAVEAALYRIPGVLEAAVVALPHPRLGEDVAACVVTKPGETLEPALMAAHCAQWLADYEVPKYWFFMDALPKNPMGKVLKRDLRTWIGSQPKVGRGT